MSVPYNVKELYSGVLHKCGAKIKSWNKRWFVLKSDYCLYYYKDTAKGHLGIISLRDPKFKVRRGTVSDTAWPKGVTMERTIAVVTSHRTYCMYSVSADEAEEWTRVLDKTRIKLIEEANSPARRPSQRPHSEITMNNVDESTRSKLFSESTPSPGQLASLEHEETYEAVYDSPEADLSQNSSPNDTPGLATKVPHTSSSSNGGGRERLTSGIETDSIYDLANAEEGVHDEVSETQPLYAEAAAPENEEEMDETSAVYDDVESQLTSGEKGESVGDGGTTDEVYDDVTVLGVTASQTNAVCANDASVETYEPIDVEHTASAKNLPLPPLPLASLAPSGGDGPLPIYEDIPDPNKADKPQPLYEEMSPESSVAHDRYVPEAEGSEDEGEGGGGTGPAPPLPPKDDLPPLPPKDTVPKLPPKDSPPTVRNVPALPPKEVDKIPPLPPKVDSADDQCNKRGIPPLPPKEEEIEESCQPLAPSRQNQTMAPPSPPPHRRRSSGSSEGSLSPSSQKKPVPKERTLTPPLPTATKPLPAPRRRVSPTASPDMSLSRSHVNGHTHSMAPPLTTPAKVTVQVISPGDAGDIGGATEGERGMELFKKRQELVKKQSETDIKNRTESIKTLTNVTSDPNLSPHHKAVFSETMREIEHERLLASEERFKWERERMKLEEERRRFEEEKRKLQEEIEQARRQLQGRS